MVSEIVRSETDVEAFRLFVGEAEPRLRQALSASLGSELGREATCESLAYAWEHWERVRLMENSVGYLYVVGRDKGRRAARKSRPLFYEVDLASTPWVEPGLPAAIGRLPDRQREVVVLLHCFEWTMSEVAELLSVSKSTVQQHAERGMAALRSALGVAT